MTYTGIQMFMEKLNQLINCCDNPLFNHPTIISAKPQLQLLYDELASMIQNLFIDQHQDLHDLEKAVDLKKRFIDAAEEAQYVVDLFLSGVHIRNNKRRSFKSSVVRFLSCFHLRNNGHFPTSDDFNPSLNLDDVRRSFKSVEVEFMSMGIDNMEMDSSRRPERTLNQSAAVPISFTRNPQASKKFDEIVVGFDHDLELIRDKLVEDEKKVDVVSIVGMGGIGKTTLATKVFNDGYVKHHFYVRVWVTVSQTYDKRDVLTQIMESMCGQLHLQKENSVTRLREMVHKQLMGKRYLIVIDDIWDIETWDNLKLFFPHDNNGSRILLTSRQTEVAKHANSDGLIHQIRYLNKERSWELLCQKVFHGNECPEWSIKHGMQIVESCHGLPLAVAVIAGVLAKDAWSEKLWVEIAYKTSLTSITGDENGCMETLVLSYNHLPRHLRECFLFLGALPEDYKFQVKRVIWLWVAEGLIEQDGNRSLEDIAQGYLMDLIDRHLVIVGDRSKSNGSVKVCKMHDLVRELCLKKAKEERFFLETEILTFSSHFSDVTTPPYKPVRMFIHNDISILGFHYPSAQNLRSILWFSRFVSWSNNITKYFNSSVLLRVLDIQNCVLKHFPKGIELLVHLRYLAINKPSLGFPASICKLWNLQTLIYITSVGSDVKLPSNISDLVNLRHLWSYKWNTFFLPSIDKPMNLQTVTNVKLGDGVHNLQNCFPYIKELACSAKSEEYDFKCLTYLEKLKVFGCVKNHVTFPIALTTLTLQWCGLPWSDMAIIQSLPNLHVLKLLLDAFKGSCWNTDEQEFRQLKFLRLEWLDIKQWEACSTSFPCLRQLEIINCYNLEEIPLEIGEILTLELIKIKEHSHSVGESVRIIQEAQHDLGNYDLKIDFIGRMQQPILVQSV